MKKALKICVCIAVTVSVIVLFYTVFKPDSTDQNAVFDIGDYTDYYYLTLDTSEKQAYTAIKQQIFLFPKAISTPQLSQEQLERVINALIWDDPMMFMFADCSQKTYMNHTVFVPNYTMDKTEYETFVEEINTAADEIVACAPNTNEFDAELYCHDYIINNCYYSDTDSRDESTVVGALIKGEATCSGYAKAFKLLLNRLGINSVLITGISSSNTGNIQNHMWNAVRIDGNWCYTDITWDDPVSDDGTAYCWHIYFNMTEDMISLTHSKFDFAEECNNPNIYYYIKYGAYFDSCDESTHLAISSLLANEALQGKSKVEIMFNSSSTTQQAKACLFENEKIYRILETAKLSSGLPIKTNTVKYGKDPNQNLITIYFEKE